MTEIPFLSSSEVFAVRVLTGDRTLRAKILVVSEDFEAGTHTLYSEAGQAFTVTIDPASNPAFDVELPLVYALPV